MLGLHPSTQENGVLEMAHPATTDAAPRNRISPEALQRLRTTRLDLPRRGADLLRSQGNSDLEEDLLGLIAELQRDLGARLTAVQNWDLAHGIRTTGRSCEDLTLANATSWAVWEAGRTLLPLRDHASSETTAAPETHSDVAADDPRWDDLLSQIHADICFISINWGSARVDRAVDRRSYRFDADFLNFHEHVPHRNEKDALLNRFHRFIAPYTDRTGEVEEFCAEHLWGGHLTDLYKGIPTPNQADLSARLGKQHRRVLLDIMLHLLEEELGILRGPVKPVLACLGRSVEGPVRAHFEPLGYEVRYVPHYSGAANHVTLAQRREAFRELDRTVGALR